MDANQHRDLQSPTKQARIGISEESSLFRDLRDGAEQNPALYGVAPAIGAGLGGLYGAFTATPGRGLLSALRGAAVGGLGGAGFSAAMHPDAELSRGSHAVRLNPLGAAGLSLGLANKLIPKVPEKEYAKPDPNDYGDESAPEDSRTYNATSTKDKKKKDAPMKAKDTKTDKNEKQSSFHETAHDVGKFLFTGGPSSLTQGSLQDRLGLGGGSAGFGLGYSGAGLLGGGLGSLIGAYQAEKGKKLRGALRGGLIGVGAGLGARGAGGAAFRGLNDTVLNNQYPAALAALAGGSLAGAGSAGLFDGVEEVANENNKDKKTDKNEKQADLYGAYLGGSNLGALGGLLGAGAGGLYGGITGAYGAPKGQKLRGALRGAGRGALSGGLLGGGAGLGLGAAMGGQLPLSQILANAKLPVGEEKTKAQQALIEHIRNTTDPNVFAGLTTAGTLGGAALGGYASNKLLRHMDKPEKEDEDQDSKVAALKLSPHTGMKTPDKDTAARNFNKMIEQARRQREAKEKRMQARDASSAKAASAWGRIKQALGGEFTDDQLKWAPAIGAGVGGLMGLTSRRNKIRNALLGAITGGGAGLGAQYGYKQLSAPLTTQEKAMRGLVPVVKADQAIGQWFQTPEEQIARNTQIKALENLWHLRGLAGGAVGGLVGTIPGGLLRESFGEEQEDDPVWAMKNKKKKQDAAKTAAAERPKRTVMKTPNVVEFKGEKEPEGWKDLSTAQKAYYAFTKKPLPKKKDEKKASAFEFGKMIKRAYGWGDFTKQVSDTWNSPGVQGFVNDPTTQAGLMYGGIGAGLGGLYGAISPGEYEDEYGQVRRRGRLMGALRGAAGGGLLGGAVGAGAQEGRHQYLKHMINQRAGFPNAMGGLDRSEAVENTEAFARNNPALVGNLATSPVGALRDAYSQYVAPQMAKFKPKKPMGQAPNTGVDPQNKPPALPTIDSPGDEIFGN